MCLLRVSANELRIKLFPSRSLIEEVRNSQYFVCIVWHLDADHLGTNVKHVLNTFPCSIQFSVCIDDSPLSLIYAHYKPSHFCCKISQKTFYLWKEKNNIIHVYCQQKLVWIYCPCLMIHCVYHSALVYLCH